MPRYSTSTLLAGLITGGLLVVMHGMIATGNDPLVDVPQRLIPTFVRPPPGPIETDRERPEPPPPPAEQPALPQESTVDKGVISVRATPPTVPRSDRTLTAPRAMDGAPIALVKVAPTYPPRAIVRGLEGYVIVEYTITSTGSVADIAVIESSDPIFEHSAIEAAAHFRYKPRVVAGEAVATPGIRNKFSFSFDE